MVDEAAREIHDAGLGATLKRLAQHLNGEVPLHPALATSPAPTPASPPALPPNAP
jgi:hypothetical protein